MNKLAKKLQSHALRKNRVRATVTGTAERPRLTVTISNLHVSAQIIDDEKQQTIVAATTIGSKQTGSMTEKAAAIGTDIAKKAKKAKVTKVVFGRNGRKYAARLKALADAARKEGMEFYMAENSTATAPQQSQQRDRRAPRRNDNAAPREEKQFEELVINIDRVSRVVKGGRRFRFKALVVVGDRKTKVGVGVSKGQDVQAAIAKATDVAKKNLITIPVVNETIPHDTEVKFNGARVLIKPAAPGTGIIAGGVVRSIIGVTGIRNLLTKSLGSTNKVNIAYATIDALKSLVPADQWVNPPKKAKKAPAKKEG